MSKRKRSKRKSLKAFTPEAGTRETRAKLVRDPIQELAYRKTIDPAHEQAAREIDAVFYARTSSLFAKTQDLLRTPHGKSNADWPATLQAAAKRYDQWANKLSHEHHLGAPPLLEVAISMIVDGHTGNEIDSQRRQRKGTASKWLVKALDAYVEIAGWGRAKGEAAA